MNVFGVFSTFLRCYVCFRDDDVGNDVSVLIVMKDCGFHISGWI